MSSMILCTGCGFNVERGDVRSSIDEERRECSACAPCVQTPRLRESYRRGFNAGLSRGLRCVREYSEALQNELRLVNSEPAPTDKVDAVDGGKLRMPIPSLCKVCGHTHFPGYCSGR